MPKSFASFIRQLLPGSSPNNRIKKALTPNGSDVKFEESIRLQMRFLFERYGASVISNQYFPDAFGNAILIIQTQMMQLRAVRDRDEVRVDVAPLQNPTEWVDSALALAAVEFTSGDYRFSLDRAITSIARHLDPNFDSLQEGFAPDQYPTTRQRIMQISELERAAAVARFNAMAAVNS